MYRHEFQGKVELDMEIWVLAIDKGFPGGSEDEESACSVGDLGSIPELGRSPWRRKCNPLQYSCLENLMDTGAWLATVHGVTVGHN